MVGRAKSCLKSNPIPTRDTQRAQTNLACTRTQRPHRDGARLCLSVSCRGAGQQWPATGAGALGAADLGMAWALLREVAINPTVQPPELRQVWGSRLWEGTNRTVCTPGPRRMEQWPRNRPTQTSPQVTQESLGEAWVGGGLDAGSGALSAAVLAWELLKEVTIIPITSTIVWPQVKQQGGNTALPINGKLD